MEENLVGTEISKLTVQMYLNEMITSNIENLILGCTHYPILLNDIKKFLPNSIKLTNVSRFSALETKNFLENNNMLNLSRKLPERFAYTTDDINSFNYAAKSFCNINFNNTEKIYLS